MTETEKKALALVNEVLDERCAPPVTGLQRRTNSYHEALCRAIEQHEAFRQEVSDAVEKLLAWPSIRSQAIIVSNLSSFIIKPPVDPLIEALKEVTLTIQWKKGDADVLRQALAARWLKIVEVEL